MRSLLSTISIKYPLLHLRKPLLNLSAIGMILVGNLCHCLLVCACVCVLLFERLISRQIFLFSYSIASLMEHTCHLCWLIRSCFMLLMAAETFWLGSFHEELIPYICVHFKTCTWPNSRVQVFYMNLLAVLNLLHHYTM